MIFWMDFAIKKERNQSFERLTVILAQISNVKLKMILSMVYTVSLADIEHLNFYKIMISYSLLSQLGNVCDSVIDVNIG